METLIVGSFHLIVFLIEVAIVLVIIDGIMTILGKMFGFSWKKMLMWAAAVFGLLWLKDFIKGRKKQEDTLQDLTEDDFEVINEE